MIRDKRLCLAFVIGALCISLVFASDDRDKYHQPNKVMDVVGVKPGMTIGEVGAGSGYFTFKLAKRVGESGYVYAEEWGKQYPNLAAFWELMEKKNFVKE
jgi:ubiquinone/menaquinone biosynthesis C-methylase UbiE